VLCTSVFRNFLCELQQHLQVFLCYVEDLSLYLARFAPSFVSKLYAVKKARREVFLSSRSDSLCSKEGEKGSLLSLFAIGQFYFKRKSLNWMPCD
jgi:hypothetical protein